MDWKGSERIQETSEREAHRIYCDERTKHSQRRCKHGNRSRESGKRSHDIERKYKSKLSQIEHNLKKPTRLNFPGPRQVGQQSTSTTRGQECKEKSTDGKRVNFETLTKTTKPSSRKNSNSKKKGNHRKRDGETITDGETRPDEATRAGEAMVTAEIAMDPTTVGDTSPAGLVRLHPQATIEGGDATQGTNSTE